MAETTSAKTDQGGSKGEFLDAVRRHICQILGFDYGFIDAASGHEITNVASFCFDDEDEVASEFVDSLQDEHKQPLTVANSLLAQKVKQTQRAWVGKAYAQEDVEKGIDEDAEGFPYVIVPVLDNPGGAGQIIGLIRVIAFDAGREVTTQDLTTLKLMGEHLATRTGLFGDKSLTSSSKPEHKSPQPADMEHIMTVHSNRLVRRRFNRILGSSYHVMEADSSERAMDVLDENRVDVILLDSELQDASGFGFCRVLKESAKWKHIPVILVVAENNTNARVEGLNVGADDCLADTCLDQEVIARVRSSLRHRKAERELAVQLQLLEDFTQRLEKAHEQLSLDRQTQIQKNAQLEQLRRDTEVLRQQDNLLHRISNIIRKSFHIHENLEEMLEALSGWFSLDCAFVVLPSEEEKEDTARVECVSDKNYKIVPYDRDIDIFEIFKKNFQPDQAVVCNDAANDRRLDPFHKILKSGFTVQSLFYVPITYEQKLLGLLGGYKCQTRASWSRINETFMKSVADQVANGVVNARLYARVQRQATTDGLTGLFNHRTGQEKLAEQLKQAERYDRRLSVIMLDVDHFKSINDTYGHPAGDTVLKSVARLIKSNCRDVDIPVRYGGEEFLLVLPEITLDGALVVAERIRNALKAEVIKHEDIEVRITGSFGVACFPDDAGTQQELLDLADKSLYLSKRLGRDQVHSASDLMFEEEEREESKTSEDVAREVRDQGSKFTPPAISEEARQQEELVPEVVDMVKSLASSLYAKSEYNKQHHLEVARMSELLAKVMGLSAQQVEQIRVAGLLHDVGLLQLPEDLLTKHGHLTESERDQVNQHATLGAQMLRPVRALKDICEILENHHERWDGTGYPRGLKGEEIPLSARIVAIVDSYHAMISDRPYRPAMPHEAALKLLKDGAGKQWDPFLVEIFSAVMKSMRETSQEVQARVAGVQALASAARAFAQGDSSAAASADLKSGDASSIPAVASPGQVASSGAAVASSPAVSPGPSVSPGPAVSSGPAVTPGPGVASASSAPASSSAVPSVSASPSENISSSASPESSSVSSAPSAVPQAEQRTNPPPPVPRLSGGPDLILTGRGLDSLNDPSEPPAPPTTQWPDEPAKQKPEEKKGLQANDAEQGKDARIGARRAFQSTKITAEPVDDWIAMKAPTNATSSAAEAAPASALRTDVAAGKVLMAEEARPAPVEEVVPVIKPVIMPARFEPLSLSDPKLDISKTLPVVNGPKDPGVAPHSVAPGASQPNPAMAAAQQSVPSASLPPQPGHPQQPLPMPMPPQAMPIAPSQASPPQPQPLQNQPLQNQAVPGGQPPSQPPISQSVQAQASFPDSTPTVPRQNIGGTAQPVQMPPSSTIPLPSPQPQPGALPMPMPVNASASQQAGSAPLSQQAPYSPPAVQAPSQPYQQQPQTSSGSMPVQPQASSGSMPVQPQASSGSMPVQPQIQHAPTGQSPPPQLQNVSGPQERAMPVAAQPTVQPQQPAQSWQADSGAQVPHQTGQQAISQSPLQRASSPPLVQQTPPQQTVLPTQPQPPSLQQAGAQQGFFSGPAIGPGQTAQEQQVQQAAPQPLPVGQPPVQYDATQQAAPQQTMAQPGSSQAIAAQQGAEQSGQGAQRGKYPRDYAAGHPTSSHAASASGLSETSASSAAPAGSVPSTGLPAAGNDQATAVLKNQPRAGAQAPDTWDPFAEYDDDDEVEGDI